MSIEKRIIHLSEVMRIVEVVLYSHFDFKLKIGESLYNSNLQAHKFTFNIFEDVELKIHFEHDMKSDRFQFEVYSGNDCAGISQDKYSESNGSIVLIQIGKFLTDVIKQKFILNI